MLVRLLLLCMVALTVVGGRSMTADVTGDHSIELVEQANTEAVLAAPLALTPPVVCRSIPVVLHGTEEEYPSPELARVFRPPRVSFV